MDNRPDYEEVVGLEFEIEFPVEEITDKIWNSIVRKYHEEVSETVSDTNLIYNQILQVSLIKFQKLLQNTARIESQNRIKDAVDLLTDVNKIVIFESYSDKSLEYVYLSDEIEEMVDEETEEPMKQLGVWADIGISCFYEVILHFMNMACESEGDDKKSYNHLINDYRKIASLFRKAILVFTTES